LKIVIVFLGGTSYSLVQTLAVGGIVSPQCTVSQNDGRPIISQPQCGRCHWAGTGQATLEVIDSKWSYTV